METKINIVEPLLERIGAYGRTSFDLIKLKVLDKTADVISSLFSRLLFVIIISLFLFSLNIAVALWLGEILGRTYYGFLAISGFYAVTGIFIFLLHPRISMKVNNMIIKKILN